MKDAVYYYRDCQGNYHFSTGVVRDNTRAEQYIRMLQYTGRTVIPPPDEEAIDQDNVSDLPY